MGSDAIRPASNPVGRTFMQPRSPWRAAAPALSAILLLSAFQAPQKPEDQFVGLITSYLAMGLPTDWDGLTKLPIIKWAPQVTSLENCLPDGGCYTLQGTAVIGGSRMTVIATGARTMALTIYFRNTTKPLGEASVVAALKAAGLTADLARCPLRTGVSGTNWYRLKGEKLAPAYLSIQPPTQARPTEGFVLSQGENLPPLQPNQVALYSEQCGAGVERQPVSTLKPHELIAQTVVALLLPATGPVPTLKHFAEQLFTTYLLPVQVVGFMLLIAMLGVIVLSRRYDPAEGAK